jgi:hypothetical protein
MRPLTCSASGVSLPSKSLRSGWACEICAARIVTSACALLIATPGFKRPTIAMVFPQRLVSGLSGNGKYRSKWLPGAKTEAISNEAGSTPATVTGSSLMVSVRPAMPASEPNLRVHRPWLNSTALGPCHLHSSAVNILPSCG